MRILKLIGAILIVFATPAFAKDGNGSWILTQKSGDVRVLRSGLQPASVQVRAALSPGDLVTTGANGRAMLTRGDDYVVVAPRSRLLLPKEAQATGLTRLIQQVGTMLYKVKHTGVPHFAVDTPTLAAVVKGTTFTVIVDDKRTAVQVTEGVVEVSSAAGNARRLVERGMTVYVGRERPDAIIEMKPGAVDRSVSSARDETAVRVEGSGDVPVSAITNLTGGLLREAPTASVAAVKDTETKAVAVPIARMVDASAPIGRDTVASPVKPGTNTAPNVTAPGLNTAPNITAPGLNTVPNVTAPGLNTVPSVTAPVVNTLPNVTAPVVNTGPNITAPVVNTVPNVTAPVVNTVPNVTAPVVNTVPNVTAPIANTVPNVTAPVANIAPAVGAPLSTP